MELPPDASESQSEKHSDPEGSSIKQESWEAYIKWLSTAEFSDDHNDESHSGSEDNDDNNCDAASSGDSKSVKSPTRDRESPENDEVREPAATDRKRKSRWEPLPDRARNEPYKPEKRSRWSPEKPSSAQSHFRDVKKSSLHMDPEFLKLKIKLAEINKKLRTGQVLDEMPVRFRSPSPEPVYDNFGNRINSRENRAREKLNHERQLILDRLAQKGPRLNTAVNRKFTTKVYIPPPQYPEYNPIGLLLGPQGLTQQSVEKETGAKLYIRGKATGKAVTPFATHIEDEKLHVRIEADNEISLNAASLMVRKLLFPAGGEHNELSLWQANPRANEICNYCKQFGHYKNECPVKTRSPGLKANQVLGLKAYANDAGGSGLPATKSAMSSGGISTIQTLPSVVVDSARNEDYSRTHVYIEHLPLSMNESSLLNLFLPFGQITHGNISRNQSTGLSKGNGFVRYVKAVDASRAVSVMNGYRLDDKVLEVKLKTSLQEAINEALSAKNSQQNSQKELVRSNVLHPHSGMPWSRAAQVSPPSSALHGINPLPISSGLEAHLGASRFLPPNRNVVSQKQPSSSSATQAGFSGSYLHYDYSPSQVQQFISSATQHGVTGSDLQSSYDYRLPSCATEAGAGGFYRSSTESQKQPVPNSVTEAGFEQQQLLKQSTPIAASHVSLASPPTGVPTRNGTTLPANPLSLAANFFGSFMMAAAAAATTSSYSPGKPDHQWLRKHSAMAGAIQDSRVAPPSSWNIAARPPFNPFTGAQNFYGGLLPPGPLQGRPRGNYAEK